MTLITVFFINTVNAHMKMSTSISFNVMTLDNSLLTENRSNFLCKQLYNESNINVLAENIMTIDIFQILSFIDSTVHEDESCQISLITDQKLSKSLI